MKRLLSVALAGCLAGLAVARAADEKKEAKKPGHMATHKVVAESDIQWTDPPPALPAGSKMAVLSGDPSKAGMFTVRLKAPDGYKIAPHWHPTTENVTVISGTFNLGVGDTMDESKTQALKAGGFASMPSKMHHYAWCKGETVVQVNAIGPFQLNYVNSADDPSKGAKK